MRTPGKDRSYPQESHVERPKETGGSEAEVWTAPEPRGNS